MKETWGGHREERERPPREKKNHRAPSPSINALLYRHYQALPGTITRYYILRYYNQSLILLLGKLRYDLRQ
jgi:hypothetical protein